MRLCLGVYIRHFGRACLRIFRQVGFLSLFNDWLGCMRRTLYPRQRFGQHLHLAVFCAGQADSRSGAVFEYSIDFFSGAMVLPCVLPIAQYFSERRCQGCSLMQERTRKRHAKDCEPHLHRDPPFWRRTGRQADPIRGFEYSIDFLGREGATSVFLPIVHNFSEWQGCSTVYCEGRQAEHG